MAAACLTLAAPAASAVDEGVLPIAGEQNPSGENHLPPQSSNMEVVSKLELTKAFGDVQPEQIADVTVHNGYAYLSSWHIKGEGEEQCRGGFYVADIRDPKNPKEIGFVAALPGSYNTEGMHAVSVNVPGGFRGDLLAVSNEHELGLANPTCTPTDQTQGGFDLFDVSDPANPKPLVRGFGDMGADEPNATNPATHQMSNEYHSAFVWQDGNSVFLVAVDNLETTDVDIFDITNPSKPVQIGDFDLEARFPQTASGPGFGNSQFLHDMVVKEINGVQTLLASYWDGGYITVNVDDPTNPKYIGDSDFGGSDPLLGSGVTPPQGNAHYAEFSYDNKFILAADEDFDPYRFVATIKTGPFAGTEFPTGTPDEAAGDINPGEKLAGPTEYIGVSCPASYGVGSPAPADSPDQIAVVQRGVCTFQEKTETAEAAGYAGVIIFNSNSTNNGCETLINMDFTDYQGTIPALFVARSTGLKILGTYDQATYECTPGDNANTTQAPAEGTKGGDVDVSNFFDAWGYTHLYRNGEGKLPEVDAFAIPEAVDARYYQGFGDLSVHEFATDPTEYLAYSAYYSGGMRVFTFGDEGLTQTGAFIDEGGSNFWGVEQFTGSDGHRYIAGSDRDFGLYIFRYTGPGAATRPDCEDVSHYTQQDTPTTIQLICKDPNNNNKITTNIERQPANGTVTLDGFKATYTPKAGFKGVDTFTYTAFDGAARSAPAQVQVFVGRCARRMDGTAVRDLLNGTPAGDAIFGGGGNDTIDGLQGDDCIAGEAGSDSLSGGDDDDTVLGGDGRDRVFGDSGMDHLRGGAERDHIRGSSGNDEVYGDAGNDYTAGGSNDDRVSGGAGNDSIRGEAGNDLLFGGSGNDSINTGEGTDKVSAGPGRDKIDAANGRKNRIRCGSGRDEVKADRTDVVSRDCERVSRLRRTRDR